VHSFMWTCGTSPTGPIWRESVTRHKWIVRDHHGAVVLQEDLPCNTIRRESWMRRRIRVAQEAEARGLPIPGTGRSVRYSRGYRDYAINIAMRSDEAALDADLAEWGVGHLRVGRKRALDLPQAWDDVYYRRDRRCWKDRRANQWR